MKARLALLIEELGILKKDFAAALEISTGNLSDWLRGKTEPSAKSLVRMGEKYRVNLNWLVLGTGPMFVEMNVVAEERAAYAKKQNVKEGELARVQKRLEQLNKEIGDLRRQLQRLQKSQRAN